MSRRLKLELFISMKSTRSHVSRRIHQLLVTYLVKVCNKHFLRFSKELLHQFHHKVDASIHIKNLSN